jgi:hypothetical protein
MERSALTDKSQLKGFKTADKKLSYDLAVRFSREYVHSAERGKRYFTLLVVLVVILAALVFWDFTDSRLGIIDVVALAAALIFLIMSAVYRIKEVSFIKRGKTLQNSHDIEVLPCSVTNKKVVYAGSPDEIKSVKTYFHMVKRTECAIKTETEDCSDKFIVTDDDMFYEVNHKTGFLLCRFYDEVVNKTVYRLVADGNY